MSSEEPRGATFVLTFLAIAMGCSHAPRASTASPSEYPIAVATRERLHSKVLSEDRIVDVYVPPSYKRGDTRYPVLYLLDGEVHLSHAAAVTRFLADGLRIPELIVVSIPNPDRSHRHRDLAPVPKPNLRDGGSGRLISETMPTAGGADQFLRFLAEELIPRMDAQYRTAPFRVLFGHSLGGLFALHAFKHRPDVFRGFVVASPALFWNDEELANSISGFASGLVPLERSVFFTVGAEAPGMVGPVRRLDAALDAVPANRLRRRFVELPDEHHIGTPHLTLYDGLKFVFEGWPLPERLLYPSFPAATAQGPAAPEPSQVSGEISSHYASLSSRYGFTVRPPAALLDRLGMTLLEAKRLDTGLDVLKRAAEFYPQSAKIQDSLADAMVRNGHPLEALAVEERAIALATEAGDPQAENFRQRLSEWKRLVATATHPP